MTAIVSCHAAFGQELVGVTLRQQTQLLGTRHLAIERAVSRVLGDRPEAALLSGLIVKRHRANVQIIAALLLLAALVPPARSTAAGSLSEITVNVFPGGFNWAFFVGQEKGFFSKNGVRIVLQPTQNSVAQMTGLASDKFDIAMTAIDNIVAYSEGQGEAPIGPQPEFVAFMGSDSGFLSLVTRPEIKKFGDLRGKTLSVDARTTGYAFVLFDILRREGLVEGDYNVVQVGGMTQRWEALRDGKQDGTLLSTPFDILAKSLGLNQLSWATQAIGPYQGIVAATKRSWALAHKNEIAGFIRGYVTAIDWLYAESNREEAIQILMMHLPAISPQLADQTYDELLDPKAGFFRQGKIDLDGMKNVLMLRSRYGQPKKELTDPLKYYDPSYYEAAMRQ